MGYHKGDVFEEIINISNKVYKRKGIALVQKVATLMKPIRRGGKITSAYYEEKSTLDFIGVYQGVPIAFDTKETKEENRFPLSNIQDHQIEFMENWYKHGGISLVRILSMIDTGAVVQYELVDEPGNKHMPLIVDGKI